MPSQDRPLSHRLTQSADPVFLEGLPLVLVRVRDMTRMFSLAAAGASMRAGATWGRPDEAVVFVPWVAVRRIRP